MAPSFPMDGVIKTALRGMVGPGVGRDGVGKGEGGAKRVRAGQTARVVVVASIPDSPYPWSILF